MIDEIYPEQEILGIDTLKIRESTSMKFLENFAKKNQWFLTLLRLTYLMLKEEEEGLNENSAMYQTIAEMKNTLNDLYVKLI